MRLKHRKGQHQFQKQLVPVYAHNIASARKDELTTRSNERIESPNIYDSSSLAEGKGYEFSAITNKILMARFEIVNNLFDKMCSRIAGDTISLYPVSHQLHHQVGEVARANYPFP